MTMLKHAEFDLFGPARPVRPMGPQDFVLGVGVMVGGQIAALAAVLIFLMTGVVSYTKLDSHPAVLISALLIPWAIYLAFTHRTITYRASGWVKTLAIKKVSLGVVALSVLIALVARVVSIGIGYGLSVLGIESGNSEWTLTQSAWLTAVLLVASGLFAPVIEEIFFRGTMLRSLAGSDSPTRRQWMIAAVGSSVAFGIMHFSGFSLASLSQIIQTGILGFILALQHRRYGMVSPVITHVVFNSSAVVLILLSGGLSQ